MSAAHAVQQKTAPKVKGASPKDAMIPGVVPLTDQIMLKAGACACGGGCPRCRGKYPLQAKLEVSQPGDALEQEADRVAEQVLRMPQPELPGNTEAHESSGLRLSRFTSSSPAQSSPEVPPIVHEVLRSPGQPLDPSARAYMEPRFGHDFARVRVHQDEKAGASASALGALAYTAGRLVVFARGSYAPRDASGTRLLAHELAHVIQQRGAVPGVGNRLHASSAAPFHIQRQPITGTRGTIPGYDVDLVNDSPQQVKSGRTVGSADLQLSYDPGTGVFTITFPLIWIFVHAWSDSQRDDYVKDFEAAVKKVWDNRFELKEANGTRRKARVQIVFNEMIVHQKQSDVEEALELSKNLAGRWVMDVRDLTVRAKVVGTTVRLGETSNKPQTIKAKELRESASAARGGTGGNKTFTQTTSAHEFGHMIGLGDEYVRDKDDAGTVPRAAQMFINNRIMNVGDRVTADAYAPFAEWLSDLTKTTWRVGRRVP